MATLEAPKDKFISGLIHLTYIKEAPFFKGISEAVKEASDMKTAGSLLKFGDPSPTDHISSGGFLLSQLQPCGNT